MAINTLDRARYNAFCWRSDLSVVKKIALALGMAAVTGLMAQARINLPWTPIPVTGQTYAALLAGVLLGQWWGGISMIMYAGIGAAGLPWFNGGVGGIATLAGPTGGYIFGFILAAFVIGYLTDKFVVTRRFPVMLGMLLAANFLLIYIPGLTCLYIWMNIANHKATTVTSVLAMGAAPFIIGDLLKAIAATTTAWAVTPKRAFGRKKPG